MKKTILYRIYAAAFIGMCLAPAVLMPVAKNSDSKEKRALAPAPELKTEDGKLNFGFFDDFSKYFSEHFAFRQELVTADGRLKSTVLGTSPNQDVIVGKDGWLYYGQTKNDFLNINCLSERGINNIVNNISIMNDCCQAAGCQYIFTVAPNKNTVYPEHMPFNYKPSDNKNNYVRLAEKLSGQSFWCDMKETILNADSSIPLYHKTDTHWNNMGAYVGHAKLMEMQNRQACSAGTRWFTRDDRLGDLAAMIYPSEDAKDTQVYNDYEFTYNYRGRFRALDDITINTTCEKGSGKLLMYRDSYGEAILPYMAESYSAAEFSRAVPYRLDGIADETVIVEIVERNLGDIQKYAPIMCAPETEVPQADGLYNGSGAEIHSDDNGMLTHVYGVLPDECFTGDSAEIFVTAGDTTYKAFNCFEDKLLDREGETCDNGFSLYIPTEKAPDGSSFTVTVVCENGRAIQVDF
ncbi:MAG: hypothetical protein GXY08_06310 [Ruminococcus sp.]|nr:hypothetical protein [Ruminococcus sp.]